MKWEDTNPQPVEREMRCGRWQLSINESRFYLTNDDLLHTPCGYGSSLKDAMQRFLENAASFRKFLDECEKQIKEELKNESAQI